MTAPARLRVGGSHGSRAAQIALPLDWSAGGANADWPLVGAANADVIAHCRDRARWPVPVSLVVGARASGKTTIARWFAAGGGAVIDDADTRDDILLFHAYNDAVAGARAPILLTATHAPGTGADAEWRVTLPDLASRLAAIPVLRIGAPDAVLAAALIDLLLARRGLVAAPGLAAWCAGRIERSFAAIAVLVDALDAAALAARRPPSIPMARAILADTGLSWPDLFEAGAHG